MACATASSGSPSWGLVSDDMLVVACVCVVAPTADVRPMTLSAALLRDTSNASSYASRHANPSRACPPALALSRPRTATTTTATATGPGTTTATGTVTATASVTVNVSAVRQDSEIFEIFASRYAR